MQQKQQPNKQKGSSQVSDYKKKNKNKKGASAYKPLADEKDTPFMSADEYYGNKDGNKR